MHYEREERDWLFGRGEAVAVWESGSRLGIAREEGAASLLCRFRRGWATAALAREMEMISE